MATDRQVFQRLEQTLTAQPASQADLGQSRPDEAKVPLIQPDAERPQEPLSCGEQLKFYVRGIFLGRLFCDRPADPDADAAEGFGCATTACLGAATLVARILHGF